MEVSGQLHTNAFLTPRKESFRRSGETQTQFGRCVEPLPEIEPRFLDHPAF
jgi:hypothetical protein